MKATWLGTVVYEDALALQRRLVVARAAGEIDDVVLLLEHDRVYTAGRHADVAAHVLGTTTIRVVPTDRGGDMTYHGPGQLVAYPIILLSHPKAARAYVEALQEACVRVAAGYGVDARPDPDRTGVWVGDTKLAAIGVRIERGVTSHGVAFNVTTDLDDFAGIVPCGIRDAGVCSLVSLGVPATVEEVADRLASELARVLSRPLRWGNLDQVGHALAGRATGG